MLIRKIFKRVKRLNLIDSLYVFFNKKSVLFWCDDGKDSNNFGDAINPILFKSILKVEIASSTRIVNLLSKPTFCFIGSILDNLNKNKAIICGTGFRNKNARVLKEPYLVLAVRGPLTRKLLLQQNINCPEVYCDPAILLPNIYKPSIDKKEYDVGIIPHYVDKKTLNNKKIITNGLNYCVIDIESDWKSVIKCINKCKYIFSSSLHGIVVAHAYGIPSTRILLSENVVGKDFKFDDYSLSVSDSTLYKYKIIDTINLEIGIKNSILFDLESNKEVFLKEIEKINKFL